MYALGCYFNEVQLVQIIIKVLFEENIFFEFVTHETQKSVVILLNFIILRIQKCYRLENQAFPNCVVYY